MQIWSKSGPRGWNVFDCLKPMITEFKYHSPNLGAHTAQCVGLQKLFVVPLTWNKWNSCYYSHALQYGWNVECLTTDNKGTYDIRRPAGCTLRYVLNLHNISKEMDPSDRCTNVLYSRPTFVYFSLFPCFSSGAQNLYYWAKDKPRPLFHCLANGFL